MASLFKIVGILLTLISCSAIGLYKASRIRHRKILLNDFLQLMELIFTEMQYFKEPLPIVFQQVMGRYEEQKRTNAIVILLRQCMLRLTTDTRTFDQIWRSAIEETYRGEPLNAADLQVLMRCGTFLGQSDVQSQKGHFVLLQGELEKQIREAEEHIQTKGRLYAKAGLSVGAVIAIALL